MNLADLTAHIRRDIARIMDIPEDAIHGQTGFRSELGAGDLECWEICFALEQVADAEFSDHEAAEVRTLDQAVAWVVGKLQVAA